MKRFAVIGDPIAHSLSPALHGELYRQLNFNASYEKIKVTPEELGSFMQSNSLNGFNVTIPHKQAAIPYLDEIDEAAQTIGAVNCVYSGKGFNTDWIGFLKTMEINDVELKGKICTILGAGGAARAVAYALIQSKIKSISIMNRTPEKTEQLIQWIQKISDIKTTKHEHLNNDQHEHIIINCTSLGMWPDTECMPEIAMQKGQILVDTVYNPLETKWLKKGKDMGLRTVSGLDMFIAQGLASAEIWFGENLSERLKITKIRQVLFSDIQ